MTQAGLARKPLRLALVGWGAIARTWNKRRAVDHGAALLIMIGVVASLGVEPGRKGIEEVSVAA